MARPVKRRRICGMPNSSDFIPSCKQTVETVEMAVEEYEVIRLIDDLGYTQEECASQMNVARTTVQAIYDVARKKIADMLVHGKSLSIRGGNYDICPDSANCCKNGYCVQKVMSECEKRRMYLCTDCAQMRNQQEEKKVEKEEKMD